MELLVVHMVGLLVVHMVGLLVVRMGQMELLVVHMG